jgi:hypothetical protein
LVHPVNAINALFSSCSLELSLDFFIFEFLFDFIDTLLCSLALGQGLLLFIPDGLLIAPQRGMEGLLQVKIASTHFEGCLGYMSEEKKGTALMMMWREESWLV